MDTYVKEMKPKILIDMSPLKAGGGCQLALNFVKTITENNLGTDLVFLLPSTGPLANVRDIYPEMIFISSPSQSFYKRLYFEYYELKDVYKTHNIKTIFTFFGSGLPHPKHIKSIVSVAYPIICYPDSPYWTFVGLKTKIRQRVLNEIRCLRLKIADEIIVETEIMRTRVSKTLNVEASRISVIKPAPSDFVTGWKSRPSRHHKNFLVLSGVARHKNLWRLPELVNDLSETLDAFTFNISVSENTFINSLSKSEKKMYQLNSKYFRFIGNIKPDEIDKAYRDADFLISMSDLESFSNNYMEAWKACLPLIVSDRDFSRSICKNSALYIEPHNPKEAAIIISHFVNDEIKTQKCIARGSELLKELPDNLNKVSQLLNVIL